MTWWEAFWLHLLKFLEAPLLAHGLVSIQRKYEQALEAQTLIAKNQVRLQAEDVKSLQKMEEQAAGADLLLPHSRQALITLTRNRINALVEERRQELINLAAQVEESSNV